MLGYRPRHYGVVAKENELMKQLLLALTLVLVLFFLINSLMENPTVSPLAPSNLPPGGIAPVGEANTTTPSSVDGTEAVPEERDEVIEWSISGLVLGPDGTPVPEGFVESDPAPALRSGINSTLCDGDGYFIHEVEEGYIGSLMVRAGSDTGLVGKRIDTVRATRGVEPTLEIHLEAGGRIDGVVVDLFGHPVEAAYVGARPPIQTREGIFFIPRKEAKDERLWPHDYTDSEGKFTLYGIPEGACSLQASRTDYGPSEPINLPPGTTEAQLVLRNECVLTGRLIDENGDPIAPYHGSICLFDNEDNNAGKNEPLATASTGQDPGDGFFTLRPALTGSQMLVIIEDDRFSPYAQEIQTVPGQNEPLEIILTQAASIRGRVVNSSGEPVAAATVSVIDQQNRFLSSFNVDDKKQFWILREEIESSRRGITAQDGTFSIRPVPSTRPVVLEVKHREYPTLAEASQTYSAGNNDVGDLVLPDGIQLRGIVLAPDGTPVSGARVKLTPPKEVKSEEPLSISFSGGSVGILEPAAREISSTTTNKYGEFIISLTEGGIFDIEASAPGFHSTDLMELNIQTSMDGIVLQLQPVQTIEGFVVDIQGNPVVGVRLSLAEAKDGEISLADLFGAGDRSGDAITTSNHDGFFSAEVSAGGFFRIKVTRGQPWVMEGPLRVEAGTSDVVVTVLDAGRIEGKVIDALNGFPVAKFHLKRGEPRTGNGLILGGSGGVEYSDPDGFFELDGLREQTYQLTFRSEGYVTVTELVEVKLGQTTQVTIPMQHSATIIGRLLDSNGKAISGARIAFARPGEAFDNAPTAGLRIQISGNDGATLVLGDDGRIRSDEEGRFRITDIAEGDWQLKVTHQNFQDLPFEVHDTAPGVITDTGSQSMQHNETNDP